MTFDKQGNLYVANSGRPVGRSGSARAYNAMGRQILAIKQVSAPVAVAFAASGNLVVANQDSRLVSAKINLSRSIHNDGPAASDATNRKWWKRLRRRILSRRSVCARCIGTDANAGYWRRCDDLGIKISPRAVVEDGLPQRLQETRVAMRSQA